MMISSAAGVRTVARRALGGRSSSSRVGRVRSLNVALTMNPLAIFSSLDPDGEKSLATRRRLLGACLLRSTKMTTLGYFRNWRTKGLTSGGDPLKRNGEVGTQHTPRGLLSFC